MAVNVAGNTHLEGGKIDSRAEVENNHFSTNSLTANNIHNYSDISVQSVNIGFSSNMQATLLQGISTIANVVGNRHENDQSLTRSAVANNINLHIKTGEIPTALSRDTENANQKVKRFDLAEIREQQETARVIGEIVQNGISLSLSPMLNEAEKEKAEAEILSL